MMSELKKLNQKLSHEIQLIILVVISVLAVIFRVLGRTGVISFFQGLFPIALILFAVFILFLGKKYVATYIVLAIMVFGNGLSTMIDAIFSFNFSIKGWTATFNLELFITAIISVYILLMLISYLLTDGIKIQFKKTLLILPLLLISVYFYFNFGFGSLILNLIPIIIALSYESEIAAAALILCNVINAPLNALNLFVSNIAQFTDIMYWLMIILAIVIIVFTIMSFMKLFKKPVIE